MDSLMQTADPRLLAGSGVGENTVDLKDRIFETLSNPRRRETIRYLRRNDSEETVLIRTLAEQIAAWENDISAVDVTYKQRKRVYTSLYQSHLPKLHRDGFIEYDADRGTIKLTPQAEQLDTYLEIVPGGELPWSEVYLGTSATTAAFVAALWFGAIPVVTAWQALVVSVAVFVVLSAVHTLQTKQHSL